MGRLIKALAEQKKHEIAAVIDEADAHLSADELAEKLKGVDAAIDFSTAEAVNRNVETCLIAKVPLVEGTTGWNNEKDAIKTLVESKKRARSCSAANFSINRREFVLPHHGFCRRIICKIRRLRSIYRRTASFAQKRRAIGDGFEIKSGRCRTYHERFQRFFNPRRKHSGNAPRRI